MIRACVAGAGGKMGSRVLSALRADEEFTITGAFEKEGSPQVGRDAGALAGGPPLEVTVSASIEQALGRGADVVIDFTAPAASLRHASACADRGVALVVGTTGLSAQDRVQLSTHAARIPVLLAPNMSVGVNVLFRLAAEAARALGKSFEVEIVELHHRAKKDAPSGTALRLAEVAAEALGIDPARGLVCARQGEIGPRRADTIGLQTLRGGDVVGDHTVFFLADGERLELTHRASSRDNFARGAVRAARFLVGKKPGLYDMQDVLGFSR